MQCNDHSKIKEKLKYIEQNVHIYCNNENKKLHIVLV